MSASRLLVRRICDEIRKNGGALGFDRFMELALYVPGLGYYAGAARKFGRDGDFVTAPELTPLFSRCVARQVADVLDGSGGVVLELGAGSGVLAADMLAELARRDSLPQAYWILEVSGELRERQAAMLQKRVPALVDRVQWLDRLPVEPLDGVILANEVMDAFPVERFRLRDGKIESEQVVCEEGVLGCTWREGSPDLRAAVEPIVDICDLADGYESEICRRLAPWVEALSRILRRGMILLFDYGYTRRDYYHPSRRQGTLACHYRHRMHADPLFHPGLQDITTHVDFTAVAEAALGVQLEVAGFATQAYFLLGCGIGDLLQAAQAEGGVEAVKAAAAAKRLLLPTEMGEGFKAMGLTRGIDAPLVGFATGDLRHRL